jgi:hypothetical protein
MRKRKNNYLSHWEELTKKTGIFDPKQGAEYLTSVK